MPFFTTDTVAAQRALEIGCDRLLMAKSGVDGVYDDDPRSNPGARKYATISYSEVLRRNLRVADPAAFSLCMDNQLPIVVFGLGADGSIARAIRGEAIGTLVAADVPTVHSDGEPDRDTVKDTDTTTYAEEPR